MPVFLIATADRPARVLPRPKGRSMHAAWRRAFGVLRGKPSAFHKLRDLRIRRRQRRSLPKRREHESNVRVLVARGRDGDGGRDDSGGGSDPPLTQQSDALFFGREPS